MGRELDRYGTQSAGPQRDSPSRRGTADRGWCWLHLLLDRPTARRSDVRQESELLSNPTWSTSWLHPPKGNNDRLMTLHLPLSGTRFATLVSVYAPPR